MKIQMKRGSKAQLPTLDVAEIGFTTDTKQTYIGSSTGNVELAKKSDLDGIITGVTGPQGPAGPQGLPGATGPQGLQGAQGPAGATGAQGPAGPQGLMGLQGPPGPQGIPGVKGDQGIPGPSGAGGLAGNVKTYGAIGDGFTDDTAAIQACLDANNFAYIPKGTYKIRTIYLNRGATIRGEGFSSVFQPYTGITGAFFSIKGDYVTFQDFYIHGSGTGPTVHGFVDFDPARTEWYSRYHFSNIIIYNIGGDAFHLTGRGLDYVVDRVFIDQANLGGYGFYGRNISDSLMTNCHICDCKKSGISIDGGNFRIVGTKVSCNGMDGYPGIEASNTLNINLSGCEIQQNVYDGMLLTNAFGCTISGTVLDSNNKIGLTGSYAQLRLVNSSFVKVDAVMVDGRFSTDTVPYNTPGLNGIVQDDKCCYNKFDITYYPSDLVYSGKQKRVVPFISSVNDITSVFKLNNMDYFNFPSTPVVIGTNATIGTGGGTGSSPNFSISAVSASGGTQVDFPQTVSTTVGSGDWYLNHLTLTMAGFTGANSPTGKSYVYVAYDSKVFETASGSFAAYITINERSTANPTDLSTGTVRIINVNKNSQWMPIAVYKPLSYSNQAGFTVKLSFNLSASSNVTLTAADIVASIRNIRVGFY